MTIQIDATYSPEDNKLRLYASERLDEETYQRVHAAGFRWAPKQKLFVKPSWSVAAEDLCIELAGEITPEQTTVAERAEAKAARLDELAEKRATQAVGFHAAARRLSERFAGGQPILVGHHSERRARKDHERMDAEMAKAVKAQDAIRYWDYRARGVERHANQVNNARTRANRIKKLLAELRGLQRRLNHAHKMVQFWGDLAEQERTEQWADKVKTATGTGGDFYWAPLDMWRQLDRGEITPADAVERCLSLFSREVDNPRRRRWIAHTLNRLAYETDMAGGVALFTGELTPVIIQGFARSQGTDNPKAEPVDGGYTLSSPAPLPLHLGDGTTLTLSNTQWRELMQSVGYHVDIKPRAARRKDSPAPLVNPTPEQAELLQRLWNARASGARYGRSSDTLEITQARYSANSKGDYGAYTTVSLDAQGKRIRAVGGREKPPAVVRVRVGYGGAMFSTDRVIVLTDKPKKALPLDLDALVSVAESETGEAA